MHGWEFFFFLSFDNAKECVAVCGFTICYDKSGVYKYITNPFCQIKKVTNHAWVEIVNLFFFDDAIEIVLVCGFKICYDIYRNRVADNPKAFLHI